MLNERGSELVLRRNGDRGSGAGTERLRWVTKDGRVRWFEAHVSVVLDSAGNAVGLRSLNLDVTASRRAEEKLADAATVLFSRPPSICRSASEAGPFPCAIQRYGDNTAHTMNKRFI